MVMEIIDNMRYIKIQSCAHCPFNVGLSFSISDMLNIEKTSHCVAIKENVEEYSKNKTIHPQCQLTTY
jgi:uncharacterized Fe-S center protein